MNAERHMETETFYAKVGKINVAKLFTVLPAKSDSDVVFSLQSY